MRPKRNLGQQLREIVPSLEPGSHLVAAFCDLACMLVADHHSTKGGEHPVPARARVVLFTVLNFFGVSFTVVEA